MRRKLEIGDLVQYLQYVGIIDGFYYYENIVAYWVNWLTGECEGAGPYDVTELVWIN